MEWIKTSERLPRISGSGQKDSGPFDGDVVDGVLVIAGGMVYQGYPTGDGDSWHIIRLGLADPPTWWMPIPKRPDHRVSEPDFLQVLEKGFYGGMVLAALYLLFRLAVFLNVA